MVLTVWCGMQRSRKAKSRFRETKAHINSVSMQMNHNLAMAKTAGTLQSSAQVMAGMSALMKIPQMRQVAMEMSKEMTKAGLMEEMMDETMEMVDGDVEEEADEEVDKVTSEIMNEVLGTAGKVASGGLPQRQAVEEEEDAGMEDIQKRLAGLAS